MSRWIRVAAEEEIPPGRARAFEAAGRRIAVFNDRGEMCAIDDTCPHRGASLAEGLVLEGRVICPWHSWMFDVRTGVCPRAPEIRVCRYAARVTPGGVEVEIPEP